MINAENRIRTDILNLKKQNQIYYVGGVKMKRDYCPTTWTISA